MSNIAYKDFRKAIRQRIWVAPSEPRNLVNAHNEMFALAMSDLSQNCELLKANNTNVFPACSTYVDRAMSVVEAPKGMGVIKRVYTLANWDWSDRVWYVPVRYKDMEATARNLVTDWAAPANEGMTLPPQGIRYADATTDSEYGRARCGWWTVDRGRLYVYPWLQSNEQLVIEWDGPKLVWGEDDQLDAELWTGEHADAVKLYTQYQHERDFGVDRTRWQDLKRAYEQARGELMERDKAAREVPESDEPVYRRTALADEITDDAAPAAAGDSLAFAFISDYGYPLDVYEEQVANLVKAWNPSFIVTAGDNLQSGVNGIPRTYEAGVGAYYGDYLGNSLSDNRLWPAIGNHDYTDPTNGIDDYLAYFSILPGSQRYYDFIKGPVHFFILNSEPQETDGVSATSTQAKWLKVKLRLSVSPWKVVMLHRSPYSASSYYPGGSTYRWPFKDWGAHLVLSGHSHAYERFEVAGLPYIVAGTGGGDLHGQQASYPLVSAYLKASNYTDHGAVYVTASCTQLQTTFVNTDGTSIDTLTIAKPGTTSTSATIPGSVPSAVNPATPSVNELEVRTLLLVMPDGTRVRYRPVLVEDAIQLNAEIVT